MGGRGSKGYARGSLPQEPQPLTLASEFPTDAPEQATEQDHEKGLESRVRDTYQELAVKPQDWVRLSKVREMLGNPDDAEFEQLLLTMTRTGLVHLAPDSNRKMLTDADHAAAIRIGSEDKHLLAIEPEYFETAQGAGRPAPETAGPSS